MSEALQPIIIRRVKRAQHGHHGGAWKVAYADFVTAMMAFFLVMWLMGMGTRQQRAAISEYFKNPSLTRGTSTMAPSGTNGPGGASNSMIKLGGAMDLPHGPGKDKDGASGANKSVSAAEAEKLARAHDSARLEELMKRLKAAIQNSQAMAPFKDQLLIDIMPEGLRIQIVDKQNRPMFDLGSSTLKTYTVAILHELGRFINEVPNTISISGHTDDMQYSGHDGYSNWELSADRANAARRALIAGGLRATKIARVVGMAAAVPFDKADPADPVNRRISIIVMSQKAQKAALAQELGGISSGAMSTRAGTLPAPAPAASAAAVPTAIAPPKSAAGDTTASLPALPAKLVPASTATNRALAGSALAKPAPGKA